MLGRLKYLSWPIGAYTPWDSFLIGSPPDCRFPCFQKTYNPGEVGCWCQSSHCLFSLWAKGCLPCADSEQGKWVLSDWTLVLKLSGLTCQSSQREMPFTHTPRTQNWIDKQIIQICVAFPDLSTRVTLRPLFTPFSQFRLLDDWSHS